MHARGLLDEAEYEALLAALTLSLTLILTLSLTLTLTLTLSLSLTLTAHCAPRAVRSPIPNPSPAPTPTPTLLTSRCTKPLRTSAESRLTLPAAHGGYTGVTSRWGNVALGTGPQGQGWG